MPCTETIPCGLPPAGNGDGVRPPASGLHAVRAARLVTPGRPPLEDGAVIVSQGRILEVGPWPQLRKTFSGPVTDLGDAVLAPGVINAHVHLELSRMRGRFVLGQGFEPWVRSMLAAEPDPAGHSDLARVLAGLKASGTAGIADICTNAPGEVAVALEASGLSYILFHEWIGRWPGPAHGAPEGLNWPDTVRDLPDAVREYHLAAAGHALYSTGPDTLRAAKEWDRRHGRPFSIHLAEHKEEAEFLMTGRGSFTELLKRRLVPKDFRPPRMSAVAYADRLGLLDASTLAVHCVHASDEDIELLARAKATVCLCPRSNEAIGVGRAPWDKLARAGVPMSLGTDSLASNSDLDVWNEARCLLDRWPGATFDRVLAMLTAAPARVLGMEQDLGALEPGRLAAFSRVPADLAEAGTGKRR